MVRVQDVPCAGSSSKSMGIAVLVLVVVVLVVAALAVYHHPCWGGKPACVTDAAFDSYSRRDEGDTPTVEHRRSDAAGPPLVRGGAIPASPRRCVTR